MKKMYLLTITIILIITLGFLLFYCDENTLNKRFLLRYGISVKEKPYLIEEIEIPLSFDDFYENYNILQIESGLNLSEYKGKKATRYTYEILNFPEDTAGTVYANVITVKSKPVAGDINCPALSGFILPLSYISSQK